MHRSTGNENDQNSRRRVNPPLSYFHYIKNAHADALPTFAVCCSISFKSCITDAFKRSFFILTRCLYYDSYEDHPRTRLYLQYNGLLDQYEILRH